MRVKDVMSTPVITVPIPSSVADVMTTDVVTIDEQADVHDAARTMLDRHIKCVPVMGGERLAGIVSRRDVLKVLARSDADITEDLVRILDDELLTLRGFVPAVSGGAVTLDGPRDPVIRHLAELLSRSVPGVIDVRFADEAE